MSDLSSVGLERGRVRLAEHDPRWSAAFEDVRAPLAAALGPLAAGIEHVGSTAVPGLPAKPIIDVAVGLTHDADVEAVVAALTGLGYLFKGDQGDEGGLLFELRSGPDVGVAHVHAVRHGDPQWVAYLAFRDRLRDDATLRDSYAALKRSLAGRFPSDRLEYTEGKSPFIRSLPDLAWLAHSWALVRAQLPSAPARILEVGCGPLGGHVAAMAALGHDVTGVDPEAPEGPPFHRTPIEELPDRGPYDVVVASLSLHHVADPGQVVALLHSLLAPGGRLVIVEWASERFDEATARWCFDRLGSTSGWLSRRAAGWRESGLGWDDFVTTWTKEHGMHPAARIRDAVAGSFTILEESWGPYYFADLDGVTVEEELAAIDAGEVTACCLRLTARRR
ncbi:GrpB family protein [Nonomuraea sp. NPDC050663]|uniref:GrpB family protein n=1 Tax=Nonomuraea sp. NPDC050663 TaxID=3364370 RepID=UPI0037A908B7